MKINKKLLEILSLLTKVLQLGISLGLSLGVIITIIYCGRINYYPSGLTTGDTIFLLSVSLGFSVIYAGIVFLLFCGGISFSPLLRWAYAKAVKIFKGIPTIDFPVLGLEYFPAVVLGFLPLSLAIEATIYGEIRLISTILIMSILFGLWNTEPKGTRKNNKVYKATLAFIILFIPLLLIPSKTRNHIIDSAMELIGVRANSAIIQLSPRYTAFLSANKIKAKHMTPKNEGIYENVTVLFRGIGNYTVIDMEGVTIIVPSNEIILAKKKVK